VTADTIVIRAPAGTKARWVRQSQAEGSKLSDWIVQRLEASMPNDEEYETAFAEAIGADQYQQLLDEQWLPFQSEHHKRLPLPEAVRREVQRAQDFLASL
jgi:hypothetical protein